MTTTPKNHDVILPTPIMMDGELRILDSALAKYLGYQRDRKFRELVVRNMSHLREFGTPPHVGRVINGGSTTEYYLNKNQALFLIAKSQTPKAAQMTVALVERFDAYERGNTSDAMLIQAIAKIADGITALTTRVEMLEGQKPARTGAATRPALAQGLKQQGTQFGLPEDAEMPEVFQPIAAYLDLTTIAPKRRFIIAGRAAQSCGNWLMKHRMSAFIRASHETGRLLFHPEGVEAWLAARSKVQEAAR